MFIQTVNSNITTVNIGSPGHSCYVCKHNWYWK